MMTETQDLLAKFVTDGSESAFRELVARYLDLVYSTAVRLVNGDAHLAEDISQIVFADLARMATRLSGSTTLGGWLHQHTCFVARTVMRGERRRQVRERQAVEMKALNDQTDSVLAQIAPVLDEAIQELGPDDRDAILLRFYERRKLRSVGEALGTTENVAQKRVSRAVQELGTLLRRRGMALSATALASGLAAGAVTAAPVGLALSIAGAVITGAGAAGGASIASAKVAMMAKLKVGIASAFVIAGVLTALFLQNQSKARLRAGGRPVQQQEVQQDPAEPRDSLTATEEISNPPPNDRPLPAQIEAPQIPTPDTALVGQPKQQTTSVPVIVKADNPAPRTQLIAKPGSKVRIEGASSVHDWQAESPFIGGSMEVGPEFAVRMSQPIEPGPVQVRADVFMSVRALHSVEKDGKPYSDKMDETMWQSLRAAQYPRIFYHLIELSLERATYTEGALQYEFESNGELAVAGITNQVTMPLFVRPMANGKLKISGQTSFNMSSFRIDPPAVGFGPLVIRVGDEVRLLFDWVVGPKNIPATAIQNEMVPLILDLPAPAFKGTSKNFQFGHNVEPLSDEPRAPMMVPYGLINLAPGSKLTSSDKNATAATLAKITDGDKSASDQSIIFLRKGPQWVQLDLGEFAEIFAVVLWHAHNTAKVYHDVIVQVSDDPNFNQSVRTIFNNDLENSSGLGHGEDREYFESYEGKLIKANGVKARCIRFYSKGSTESALNEYTEIEVYGRPEQ